MIQLPSRIRPLAAIAASACTVFLLGCPQQQTAAKPPANATAPALPKTVGGNNAQTAEQTNPRIAELIQQVDRSYRSGVQNYRAGNLDGARSDFDHAVDLMLTSGLDIKSDPTLSDEFERTVDAVKSLEMDALKQGNGFSPKQEETPLEAVNDLTFSPEMAAKQGKALPSDPVLDIYTPTFQTLSGDQEIAAAMSQLNRAALGSAELQHMDRLAINSLLRAQDFDAVRQKMSQIVLNTNDYHDYLWQGQVLGPIDHPGRAAELVQRRLVGGPRERQAWRHRAHARGTALDHRRAAARGEAASGGGPCPGHGG